MDAGIRRVAGLVCALSAQVGCEPSNPVASTDAASPTDAASTLAASTDAAASTLATASAASLGPQRTQPLTATPSAESTPPPLSGGTLTISPDGETAVVSDPDLDRVLVVDLARGAVRSTVTLSPHDEPGRVVVDGSRRAHVALRRGGALVTIDLASGALLARRAVCPSPRGVAWRAADDAVVVACAGGELVTLPAAGGDATARVTLDRDLRDVIVQGDVLLVTRFRDAVTLVVRQGHIVQRIAPEMPAGESPSVAWRAVPAPSGGFWLLHERAGSAPIAVASDGYYAPAPQPCSGIDGIVRPGLVRINPPFAATVLPDVPFAPLAIDVAAHPTRDVVALAVPGAYVPDGVSDTQLVEVPTTNTRCLTPVSRGVRVRAQVVAVAYTPSGRLVAQGRAPASLMFADGAEPIPLGGADTTSEGHRLFHTNPTGTMTCALCHAEGGDDGRVWNFALQGPRRTPSLGGGLLDTAPFHWRGDLANLDALVLEVMVRGMHAPMPDVAGVSALGRWLDAIPARPSGPRDDAAARGEALFRSDATGCATCHSGPRLTNNATVDVGTGGAFQVPALRGMRWRAPYMHDGCAATVRDRFGRCGGGDAHGHTSQLTAAEIDDLAAYMDTL